VIPVNPRGGEILGEKVYEKLADVPEAIDVVDVFRPSEETPGVARDAVAAGAHVLWLQEGISSEEAERIASDGGLEVVMDMCMGATHHRLINEREGPGPSE
jgi:predicted CoA-binding protein